VAPKRRVQKPGPPKDGWDWSVHPHPESAGKFREFSEKAAKEGWDNPYPTLFPESPFERQNEALRKHVDHQDAELAKERGGRVKGGKNRGVKNVERDRRWHDLSDQGKTAKEIAFAEDKPVTTVYGVLRKPRP
jgi:hypothetical protein